MECDFGDTKREDETYACLNPGCGRVMRGAFEPWQFHAPCRSGVPARPRPGQELFKLIDELELKKPPGCKCAERARLMDGWGVELCRLYRSTIIGWLKESFHQVSWSETIAAYAKLRKADWFSHRDPYGSIVDEALRRASNTR